MGCPVSMIGLYAGAEINCKSGCSLSMLSSGSRKFVSTLESQLWFDSQFDFDRMAYTFFSSWSGVYCNIAWSDRCKELPPNAEIPIPHSRLQNYSHRCYFGLQGSVLRGLVEPGMGTPLCICFDTTGTMDRADHCALMDWTDHHDCLHICLYFYVLPYSAIYSSIVIPQATQAAS